jgi:hypothetical protein
VTRLLGCCSALRVPAYTLFASGFKRLIEERSVETSVGARDQDGLVRGVDAVLGPFFALGLTPTLPVFARYSQLGTPVCPGLTAWHQPVLSRRFRQLFTEAILISLAGGALGLWGSIVLCETDPLPNYQVKPAR